MVNVKKVKNRAIKLFSAHKYWLELGTIILIGSSVLTAILVHLNFSALEANLYDFRMARGSQPTASPDIVLISIDSTTSVDTGQIAPLPLELHTQVLEKLKLAMPRAVGLTVDYGRLQQIYPESFEPKNSQKFVAAAQELMKNGVPVILGSQFDVTGEVPPPAPLTSLPYAISVIHKDGNVFGEDKVTRRAGTFVYGRPTFHTEIALRIGALSPRQKPRGNYYVPEVDGDYFFFRYHGKTSITDQPYTRYSFSQILNNQIPAQALKGKIVLIGTMTKEDYNDYSLTPYSRTNFTNPKLVLHANVLDTLLQDNGIIRAPNWVRWVTTFAATAFVIAWVLISTPLNGVLATFGLALIFAVACQLTFSIKGIWIRESHPLIGIFLSYYLVVPYRLIREYEQRWEFQRKNELLTQVEELKTNFLRLVTHDLKTPVARIQGLAEVLIRKITHQTLVPQDQGTLHQIVHSTEELNHFITSILELTRLDSNPIQLHLESKDINDLIEKSLERFSMAAKAKNIQIESHLDPLFPIKVDPTLITKVLCNLIDNAIKYSPTGSKISISSREVETSVEVSVQDQGIGMQPNEVNKLFTRFYRAKNPTTEGIAGTGLGLYLSKYFIEAHQGSIAVQSIPGSGTQFILRFPLDVQPVHHARLAGLNFSLKSDQKRRNTHV